MIQYPNKIFSLVLFTLLLFTYISKANAQVSVCEISNIFQPIEPESGTRVVTIYGELQEVEMILHPSEVNPGSYKVELTRRGTNLYVVKSPNLFIETKYCHQFASHEKCTLVIEGKSGNKKGVLIFE